MIRKLLYIIIILAVCVVSKSSAQLVNLIHNAGMEDPSNVKSPMGPGLIERRNFSIDGDCDNDGPFEGLEVWEDRLKEKDKCPDGIILHSPDWFSNSIFDDGVNLFGLYHVGDATGPMQAQEGNAYIGLGTCELVQQQFFQNTKLKEGEEYTLIMHIRPLSFPPLESPPGIGQQGNFGNSATATLMVYLRKTKMRYSDAADNKNNHCTGVYCNKANMDNTITILSINIDLTNFPSTGWHLIGTTFTAPSDDHDWFVIENLAPNDMCDSYILIDNVTLARTCEFPSCDRTTGLVIAHTNSQILTNTPFKIWDLNNVFSAKLEIYNADVQWIYESPVINCTNGIMDTLYWDGTNSGGDNVDASQIYYFRLTIENECGVVRYPLQGLYKEAHFTGTIPAPLVCNNSGVKTPIPCCTLEPDIFIDNVTISGPGVLEYHAFNSIIIGPNVTVQNGAELILNAGVNIEGVADINVEPGSVVSSDIIPCTGKGNTSNNNYVGNDNNIIPDYEYEAYNQTTYNTPDTSSAQTLQSGFNIYPNPYQGSTSLPVKSDKLFVDITGNKDAQVLIVVVDMLGIERYSKVFVIKEEKYTLAIDPEGKLPAGVYMVIAASDNELYRKKIVIQ